MLVSMLRNSDYEVSEAATGTEAIEKAVSAEPNLIVLDIELLDLSGVAVRKQYVKIRRLLVYPLLDGVLISVGNIGKLRWTQE